MVRVTCVEADGREVAFDAPAGWSLMQAARRHGVEGILAVCGGACACATCHCYVEPPWAERLPAPSKQERQMLANVVAERRPSSRLSCQLRLEAPLDGMRVTLPERQD